MWFKKFFLLEVTTPTQIVTRLPLPPLLIELIESGRWQKPSNKKLQSVIPFLKEPVDFVKFWSPDNTWVFDPYINLANDPKTSNLFQEYLGSRGDERDLPWLDAEKSIMIAVNREHGADLGIALDYRTDFNDPRVVASDWWTEEHQCNWRLVEERFSIFVEKLQL